MCCKELGHKTEDCPRDPNIKTSFNALGELKRIKRIRLMKRKLFMFTNIMTTQLLKTCVKVPKINVEEVN